MLAIKFTFWAIQITAVLMALAIVHEAVKDGNPWVIVPLVFFFLFLDALGIVVAGSGGVH